MVSCFFYPRVYGQQNLQAKVDSLQRELPGKGRDSNKVKLLRVLAWAAARINPDEGLRYGMESLRLSDSIGWKKGYAMAHLNLGNIYSISSDYKQALRYYEKTFSLAEAMGDKKISIYALGSMGNVYLVQRNFAKTMECYDKTLTISGATGDTDTYARTLSNIGLLYYEQSNYAKALEYQLKAMTVQEKAGDYENVASDAMNIGNIYHRQKDFDKAEKYLSKALEAANATGSKKLLSEVAINIGQVYLEQKKFDKALSKFFSSLRLSEELGNKLGIVAGYINIGSVYQKQQAYSEAITYHMNALKLSEELGDKMNIANALTNISQEYFYLATDTAKKKPSEVMRITDTSLHNFNIPNGKQNLLHTAVDYLNKAIAIYHEIEAMDDLATAYLSLAAVDTVLGDFKGAYSAISKHKLYQDSVHSMESKAKIVEQQMQYDYDKQMAINKAAQAAQDARQRNVRNSLVAGMAGLLLFSGIVMRQRNQVRREKKNVEIERERSDNLLLNILPAQVAEELKEKGVAEARQFDTVTVLFTDFVNFTSKSEIMSPQRLIEELHTCFRTFDEIITRYGIEKIKTIGDAYLAVAGLPENSPNDAENIVRAAIEIRDFMESRNSKLGSDTFNIRIGLHTGNVIAGIVGVKKFAYDVWGDTVNTAARMEQNCEPGKVNISEATYDLIKEKFSCHYRGEIQAKNKGMLKMYYVN